MTAVSDDAASVGAIRRLRSIMAGSAGNMVEVYDWFAYASFAIYFAKVFFPHGDQTLQLLYADAVFLAGFLFRPLGAWLMGLYADRSGRRAAMVLSILTMCLGSLIIALCPGYAAIGPLAPLILVLARILQGISMGGEYGTSATYVSEMAGRKNRGFWSGIFYMTLILGQLGAALMLNLLHAVMPQDQLQTWGWRADAWRTASGCWPARPPCGRRMGSRPCHGGSTTPRGPRPRPGRRGCASPRSGAGPGA